MSTMMAEQVLTGQERKQLGLDLVGDHNKDWAHEAVNLFRAWSAGKRGRTFRLEEFREFAEPVLIKPTSHNVFGALPRRLIKEKLITETGLYEKSQHPAAHSRPVRTYLVI